MAPAARIERAAHVRSASDELFILLLIHARTDFVALAAAAAVVVVVVVVVSLSRMRGEIFHASFVVFVVSAPSISLEYVLALRSRRGSRRHCHSSAGPLRGRRAGRQITRRRRAAEMMASGPMKNFCLSPARK